MDFFHDFFTPLASAAADNKALLLGLATSALGSGFGAWFGAQAILTLQDRGRARDIQSTANISIAALVALLGKLINFKKDLVVPAQADAKLLGDIFAAPAPQPAQVGVKLELWPEVPFELRLPHEALMAGAGDALDLIQLLKMLDYNLSELSHMLHQRNALIRQMNAHQAAHGSLPTDGMKLYLRYANEISRNVDENLFFIDRGIVKVRDAARKRLPGSMHRGIADVGLKPETAPLMPPKDLIKGMGQ